MTWGVLNVNCSEGDLEKLLFVGIAETSVEWSI